MANNENSMNRSADAAPPTRTGSAKIGGAIMTIVMIVALAVGTFALSRLDTWGERSATVPQRFQLDLQEQVRIPPELIGYAERFRFDTSLQEPHALAVSSDGTILVAGDQAVARLSPAGRVLGTIPLAQIPTCLAVAGAGTEIPERIYVGCGRHVSVFSALGEPISQWPDLEPNAVLTAIAIAPQRVFVADAGQKVVHILDLDGRVVGRIGEADPARPMPGFVIPSPYFDLVAGPDETLWVVNPGMRRVESYSFTGELQAMWGRAGAGIADFFGCCNPAHLAMLPDGRFVTSEKGIPRIKIYSNAGEFERVVAGPVELGVSVSALVDARGEQVERVFDVAVAQDGAVLVLDTLERCIRVFYPKGPQRGSGHEA
jgi:hypothetical protein